MSVISVMTPAAVPLTMSSLEIAELTGRDHKNVLRDIRVQLLMILCGDTMKQLHLQCTGPAVPLSRFVGDNNLRFFEIYLCGSNLSHQQNQGFSVVFDGRGYLLEILLCKEHSITLLTGYDLQARHRVVLRWQELEAGQKPAELSRIDILKMAIESEQGRIEAEAQLALVAPKVAFMERYVQSTGNAGFREVAKLLGAKEYAFKEFLIAKRVVYPLAGRMTPYSEHIEAKRFFVRTGTSQRNEHSYVQAQFTPKGIEWIAGLWGKHKAALALEGGAV